MEAATPLRSSDISNSASMAETPASAQYATKSSSATCASGWEPSKA
eukprot:CAMPEP_0171115876 /NCGR_PEP_ID=MMETSP0766_2-20121228/89056_1 /TAXON_ID=439317 /ORGANISM="Gambierdiscus australes, Strain CAWD 149" /LENGTH=45 /DNA_ID= /DNA_START= /DNA_END= /DNA_ORIENTATION=